MLFSLSQPFALLFQQHQQELLKFAGRHANDDIAEDLVQEAYLRLIRQAETETISNPRAYFYKLTRNLSIDYLRQGQIRSRYLGDGGGDPISVPDARATPETIVEAQDVLHHCLGALNELPEIQRHVFLLHRLDGMTYAEISTALGIPARTVERYAAKALAHCFSKVKDCH